MSTTSPLCLSKRVFNIQSHNIRQQVLSFLLCSTSFLSKICFFFPKIESLLGLLRIHVHRRVNLVVRDVKCNDPYVVIRMGKQVKTDLSYFELTHNCTPELNTSWRIFQIQIQDYLIKKYKQKWKKKKKPGEKKNQKLMKNSSNMRNFI